MRNVQQVYAYAATVQCAQLHGCVPCAYKLGTFDVALDSEFCAAVPNQRPELCRRNMIIGKSTSSRPHGANVERTTFPSTTNDSFNTKSTTPTTTTPSLRVLLVGDGDFSFSLAMARRPGYTVVATSYESKETLEKVYDPEIFTSTLEELKERNATISFNVDATNLKETLPASFLCPADDAPSTSSLPLFDRIIWNFPCSAVAKGQDGQNDEMDHNKQLVRDFVKSALPLLTPITGQIHMNHKTKPPFDQWNLQDVVVVAGGGDTEQSSSYVYRGCIVLDRLLFEPYVPRKALDRKSFSCHDACTFVFGLRQELEEQEEEPRQEPLNSGEGDGSTTTTTPAELTPFPPLDNLLSKEKQDAMQLVPLTTDLLSSIRTQFIHSSRGAKSNIRKRRRKKT